MILPSQTGAVIADSATRPRGLQHFSQAFRRQPMNGESIKRLMDELRESWQAERAAKPYVESFTTAAGIVFAAAVLQSLLWQFISPLAWTLFYPAVILTAFIAGVRAGYIAALISAALGWYFFLKPEHLFFREGWNDVVGLGLFLTVSFLISTTVGSLRALNDKRIAALAASIHAERRYRGIIEAAPDPMIVANGEGRIVLCNEQALRTFGYLHHELIGNFLEILLPPNFSDNQVVLRQCFADTPAARQMGEGKILVAKRKDGTTLPIEVGLSPWQDGDNLHVTATIRDISKQQQEEKKLRLALIERQLFAALIENCSDFIGIAGPDGKPLYLNPAGRRMVGLAPDLPIETTQVADFYPPDQRGFVQGVIFRQTEEQGSWQGETSLRHWQTNAVIPVSDTHFLIRSIETDELLGIGTITRDISDIARARASAESANQAKSDFVASVSHEIRTPLGIILGYADMLFNNADNKLDRRHFADAIRRNGQHLLALVNDILDLSKVEAGKMLTDKKVVQLVQFLFDMQSQLQLQASAKGLSFSLKIRGTVPSSIVTDETRLRQILVNVVGNAIKFTENGGIEIEVSLKEDCTNQLEFTVSDTGCGIAAKSQRGIFEPFTQAERYISRRYGGTGLGLGLSRKLAHSLGGDVTLKSSTPGLGSTFAIAIEVDDAAASSPINDAAYQLASQELVAARIAASSSDATGKSLAGTRVLLVEDCEDNQYLIRMMLESAGATVTVAENGMEGVRRALRGAFDAVLMDIQMPIMSGYEAAAKLRAEGYAQPIIALTAHAMTGELERCIAAGCDGYIAKPIRKTDLIREIAAHVASSNVGAGTALTAIAKQLQSPAPAVSPVIARTDKQPPLVSAIAPSDPLYDTVRIIVGRLPAYVSDMRSHISRCDWQALAVLAHQVKGVGGSIGFDDISQVTAALEECAKSEPADIPCLISRVQEFATLVERITV
jgi:PAS domain S-box-containing protein